MMSGMNELEDLVNFFRKLAPFKRWKEQALTKICEVVSEAEAKMGAYIYKEEEAACGIYFIQSGECELRKLVAMSRAERTTTSNRPLLTSQSHRRACSQNDNPLFLGSKQQDNPSLSHRQTCTLGILSPGECFGEEEVIAELLLSSEVQPSAHGKRLPGTIFTRSSAAAKWSQQGVDQPAKRQASVVCRSQVVKLYCLSKSSILKLPPALQHLLVSTFKPQIAMKRQYRDQYIVRLKEEASRNSDSTTEVKRFVKNFKLFEPASHEGASTASHRELPEFKPLISRLKCHAEHSRRIQSNCTQEI